MRLTPKFATLTEMERENENDAFHRRMTEI